VTKWVLIFLAVWFGLWGLLQISNFQIEQSRFVLGAVAVTICILIFVGFRGSPPPA
jgi:hypothetical protein